MTKQIQNSNFQKIKYRKGITLIEVLVTAGLTSAITILIVSAYLSGLQSSDFNFKRFQISLGLDSVMNTISQYSLLASSTPLTFNYNNTTYQSDADTLILQLPSIDSTGALKTGFFDSVIYDYDVVQKQLNELIIPDSQSNRAQKNKTVLDNVSAVSFTQINSPKGSLENIEIKVDTSSYGKTGNYTLSRSIRLRNQE